MLYKPDLATLERTLLALQVAGRLAKDRYVLSLKLILVDNSCDPALHGRLGCWLATRRAEMPDWTVDLLLSPGNGGYGRGNNLAIERIHSDYHLVINPDLFVAPDALSEALNFLEGNPEAGLLTPAVFGEDGHRHYLCKRNPTLLIMFLRSFSPKWLQSWFKRTLDEFEMLDCDYERPIHVEYPTGSCMFFRTTVLKQIGGFDPDYFLHYEDADIGRRAGQFAKVIYVPTVRVVHQWARDTHHSWKSRLVTVRSGLLYWRKWGGVFVSKPDDLSFENCWLAEAVGSPSQLGTDNARAPAGGPPSSPKILVTGANGFVGRAVCADLPSRGYSLRGVVRHGHEIKVNNGCECFAVDEMDADTDWTEILQNVDSVIHLAARVHLMRDTAADPLTEYRLANVLLTLNLARQAAKAGVRRFVFVSSIKVNGETTPVGQPFTPEDTPQPIDPYGISKLEAEQGLMDLAAETGMEVVIIRPVLVYGPGVKANFYSMMYWVSKGMPMPLGALRSRRSFLALDNLVDLIAVCLEHPAAANEIFLASDGFDVSISWLLRQTGAALNKSARLVPIPLTILRLGARILGREAILQRLCDSLQVDISKTRRLLDWTPPVRMAQGLRDAARYFCSRQ